MHDVVPVHEGRGRIVRVYRRRATEEVVLTDSRRIGIDQIETRADVLEGAEAPEFAFYGCVPTSDLDVVKTAPARLAA